MIRLTNFDTGRPMLLNPLDVSLASTTWYSRQESRPHTLIEYHVGGERRTVRAKQSLNEVEELLNGHTT